MTEAELPERLQRLIRLLGRHTRDSDKVLADVPAVLVWIERWEADQAAPVIDVGE